MRDNLGLLAPKPAVAKNRVQNLLRRLAQRRIMGFTRNDGDSSRRSCGSWCLPSVLACQSEPNRQGKVFFFVNKKEAKKTLLIWARTRETARALVSKSFLLLFYKKAALATLPYKPKKSAAQGDAFSIPSDRIRRP
ncbi:hypothetical protein AruPA_14170 [Acidiphilium sp. PA]|uniref:hypothetical protein n=1 Tax=Acidiphilium sp. PA TaxID=2871705 RepID=UPI0022437F84|nr:hypothetical protein [Acidiphilium sp. PA]MCW8308182.1 hypothetical protein [Acidiphilium sp. PA]